MDSYELAVKWVTDALEREIFDQRTDAGCEIEVRQMQKCDCIPVEVGKGMAIGRWDLVEVRRRRSELVAAYQKRA